MPLDQRLQVLIDVEQLGRLRRESERTGAPIGAIVREAIDARLGGSEESRRAAFGALLTEPLPQDAEPDWATVKVEMLAEPGAVHDDGRP